MPRIKQNKAEYVLRDNVKALHGRLLAEGVRDREVAKWLGCTSQNCGYLFKKCSFSYRQIIIIEEHLQELTARKRQVEMKRMLAGKDNGNTEGFH